MREDEYIDDDGEEASGFDLGEILGTLRRRWLMIVSITLVFASLAAAFTLTMPNFYTAAAAVQIDKRNKKITHIDGVLSDLIADTPTLESEVEVLGSSAVALEVIKRLNLRSDPEFSNVSLIDSTLGAAATGERGKKPGAEDDGPSLQEQIISLWTRNTEQERGKRRDYTLRYFLGSLRVQRVRNSLIIKVEFTSRDPVKAARIANTIVEVYIERQYKEKRRATEIAVDLIDKRLGALREGLAVSERKIEKFKSANDIYDSNGQVLSDRELTSHMEALVRTRNQTTQARSRYLQALRIAKLPNASEAISEVIKNNTIRLLRTGLSNALRRHAELASKYGPLHPQMRRSGADVAKARAELNDEIAKVLKTLKVEYDVARNRQTELEKQFKALKGNISTTKAQKWELTQLQREAKANHQLYEVLLARKKQAEQTLGMHFPDAKVIAQAEIPFSPSHPKRKKLVLMAFGAGLVLALGLAVLLDQLAGGLTNPEKIEKEFSLPHLASTPKLHRRDPGLSSPLRALRLMLSDPGGPYAEAMRELRYELDWRHTHQTSRIILIASALPKEGKTMLASNLAHCLATSSDRILLIDADMRRQTLTEGLSAANRIGLYEVLCKGQPIETAILKDDMTGLSFLPAAGTRTTGAPPAEILASRRTQNLLARLKSQYETIIVDSPALLPVIDTRILAGQVDQIVLTMNWYSTPKRAMHRAIRSLALNSRKTVGVILNGTPGSDYAEPVPETAPSPTQTPNMPKKRRAA